MQAWIQKAMNFADRFVPDVLRAEGGDRLRDARTLVLVSFLLGIWGPPFTALNVVMETHLLLFVVFTGTMVILLVPFLMRLTGSLKWSIRLALTVMWWVLFGSAFALDGLASPSLLWLPALPLSAIMLLGSGEALGWALFTALCFASLPVADSMGVHFRKELSGAFFNLYWGACAVSAVAVFCSIGAAYEATKNRMQADLQEALSTADEALAGTRLVLDNVDQGLLILNPQGQVGSQASQAMGSLLGEAERGTHFSELLAQADADFADWWALAWESVSDGFLPLELAMSQLPSRLEHRERSLQLHYQPIMDGEELTQVIVVVNDISADLAQERAQVLQQEVLAVFQHLTRDPGGFEGFLREARSLLSGMPDMRIEETLRTVHTLKGNAGLFSVRSVVEVCHRVEDALIHGGSEEVGLDEVLQAWGAFEDRLSELRGEDSQDTRPVLQRDLDLLLDAIDTQQDHRTLLALIRGWDMEDIRGRLQRFGEQSKAIADRLGKWGLRVEVDCGELRVDPLVLQPLWSAFAHAARNAVDHGIETPIERLAANKSAFG
ncbi:MAG: HPt (histidine-containing phosphotransfer) domain-containing protein, partial [Cognaticolwellia sp.]